MEKTERKQTARLTLLTQAAELLLDDDTSETGVDAIFRLLAPHFGLDSYWDYDSTETGDGLRLASSAGLTDETAPAFQYLPLGQALCGTCPQKRAPQVMDHHPENHDNKAALHQHNPNHTKAC